MNAAEYAVHGDVAVVTLSNPPVNGLGHALRQGIVEGIERAVADRNVKAVVLIGAGNAFSGGADIREFNTPAAAAEPHLRQVIEIVERAPKPVVAAIHKVAMGGGLELALGCHYRVAAPGAQLALPEVKLGILPGAGGTQRLPRAIDARAALDMMLNGSPVPSDRAPEGLVDEIARGADLLQDALAFARRLISERRPLRKLRDEPVKLAGDAATVFAEARQSVAKGPRGFPAPPKIVDCVEAALKLPFDEGAKFERERYEQLVASIESKAMRHAFFAERAAAKIPDVPDATPTREIAKVAIVGAGTMGGGIAMAFVNAGLPVTLLELKQEALDRGLETIRKNYAATVARGRLSEPEMAKRMALLSTALAYDAIRDADLVVEAVFEDIGVKESVFRQLDEVMKAGSILATNTSTLDVNRIAAFSRRPQDVIGMHFFSPANVMRLLEVVRGASTSTEVLATVMRLAKTIRKVGVVSGVCDGFIGNRMLEEYLRQAYFLVEEGALPQQVDKALQDWGLAMGPFAMMDMAGQDIGWHVRKRRRAEDPERQIYPAWLDRVCEMGRFGQKTGKGVYKYEAGSRTPLPDPEIEQLIMNHSKEIGVERRGVSDQEIVERCIFALVNEGAKILEEGIALRASDIDTVYLTGYGFPPYRGGPMFYADTVGLTNVLAAAQKYAQGRNGQFWKPAALLARLAGDGKTFN
ncbi:MAG TPA: 3-hydroxyacyl-CoA dehydrogenase NAD-binding domain-containing protein [Burkholderiales bacterium]|nr:3-hydroxyacyl-CoA dehydrogenase NAD-binding domain-containing protein [Burkholderiales bacterium]